MSLGPDMKDRLQNDTPVDMEDAVLFAEGILEDSQRCAPQGGARSVPEMRRTNLARAFLRLKFPFQCCGKALGKLADEDRMCKRCPMKPYNAG